MDNRIMLVSENDENIVFNVIEETKLNGINYILVTSTDE